MWEENTTQAPAPAPKKSGSSKSLFMVGGLIVLVLVAVVGGYLFIQFRSGQGLFKNSNSAQADVKSIVDKVAAIIDLPKNETPQVLNVSDKYKLNNQPFFAKTENGDKVLIYPNSHIAVLFRPSTNKIINYITNATFDNTANKANTPGVAGASTSATPTPKELSPTPIPTQAVTPTKAAIKSIVPTSTVTPTVTTPTATP